MEVSLLALMTGIQTEGAPQPGAAPDPGFAEAMLQAMEAQAPPGGPPPPNLPQAVADEGVAIAEPNAPSQKLDLHPQINPLQTVVGADQPLKLEAVPLEVAPAAIAVPLTQERETQAPEEPEAQPGFDLQPLIITSAEVAQLVPSLQGAPVAPPSPTLETETEATALIEAPEIRMPIGRPVVPGVKTEGTVKESKGGDAVRFTPETEAEPLEQPVKLATLIDPKAEVVVHEDRALVAEASQKQQGPATLEEFKMRLAAPEALAPQVIKASKARVSQGQDAPDTHEQDASATVAVAPLSEHSPSHKTNDGLELETKEPGIKPAKSEPKTVEQPQLENSSVEEHPDELLVKGKAEKRVLKNVEGGEVQTPALETQKPAAPVDAKPREVAPREVERAIKQISDRIEMLAAKPRGGVTIHLRPDDLGTVTLVVKTIGDAIDAQMYASDESMRQALEKNHAQLTQAIEARGMRVNEISISNQPLQSGLSSDSQARQGQPQQPSQQQQPQAQQGSTTQLPGNVRPDLSVIREASRKTTGVDLWM